MDKQSLLRLSLLKKEIELNQLKSQLYPHFLFNALNNIYSYTMDNSRYGNELILKLSDLMRFVLDAEKKEQLPIEQEVKFIENYIAFEKERLGDRCQLNYSKNIKYYYRPIAPLLLFPFIENAFKYGANTIQNSHIDILLTDTSREFKLMVKNTILSNTTSSTKTGINNSKRRLELLYPGNHHLSIDEKEKYFCIELILRYENGISN